MHLQKIVKRTITRWFFVSTTILQYFLSLAERSFPDFSLVPVCFGIRDPFIFPTHYALEFKIPRCC